VSIHLNTNVLRIGQEGPDSSVALIDDSRLEQNLNVVMMVVHDVDQLKRLRVNLRPATEN